jgi:hypothetical protein
MGISSTSFIHLSLSLFAAVGIGVITLPSVSYGIDLSLSMEEANKSLAAGRQTMESAESVEDVAAVMKASEKIVRVGADPEVDPCGTHAILRTRRYWLEYFGRREAAESTRQQQDIRMPESKIPEILAMPYLEVEVRLCGEEEFFAEGAEIALQQGNLMVRPVDIGPAERAQNAHRRQHDSRQPVGAGHRLTSDRLASRYGSDGPFDVCVVGADGGKPLARRT